MDPVKSMDKPSEHRYKMPTVLPPTPEERLSGSFSDPALVDTREPVNMTEAESTLPTPNSPLRHSFSQRLDDHHIHDPIVVPHGDEVSDSAPLFGGSQRETPPLSPYTPRRNTPVPESPSTPTDTRHASIAVDSPRDVIYHPEDKVEQAKDNLPRWAYVPGTTFRLPNTKDAVQSYHGRCLAEIENIQQCQKIQRDAREPAARTSADSFTQQQLNWLKQGSNPYPTIKLRKRPLTLEEEEAKAVVMVAREAESKQKGSMERSQFAMATTFKTINEPTSKRQKKSPESSQTKATIMARHPTPTPRRSAPHPRQSNSTPKARQPSTFDDQSPQPVKHQRGAAVKSVIWNGKQPSEWREVHDYTPSMDRNTRLNLKQPTYNNQGAQKKQPGTWTDEDMNKFQAVEELLPEEYTMARELRIEPQLFLITKRRIFAGRINSIVNNSSWNKTSAQMVAKLDVNKASKIFTAYEGGSWFDEDLYTQAARQHWQESVEGKKLCK